jgi:hypothetical protein
VRRRIVVVPVVMSIVLLTGGMGLAQQRDSLPGLSGDLTPGEVQQLFDAFELVRAQEMLDLNDEQYPQFVARLKALQETRRDGQQRRMRMLRELQGLATQETADDAELQQRLDEFKTMERETAAARAAAYDDIDAMLDLRQQVRFRMFEQTMERRRLDLLMRARRQQPRRPGPQPR